METREEEERGLARLEAGRGQCTDKEEPRGARVGCRMGLPHMMVRSEDSPIFLFPMTQLGLPLDSYTI